MYKRLITSSLDSWASSSNRKPLVLRGARQVGKTTTVVAFAENYEQFIHLNLDIKADRDLFEQGFSPDELIAAIHFHKNLPINIQAKTLIFIDEIQSSPEAVAMLRYFYEQYNHIHVIAAGSLLETLIDTQISFPVGRVEYKWLYPFSFLEYLYAANENEAVKLLEQENTPEYAHDKLLKLFHDYVLVGAMPEAITAFLENRDILAANKVHENLMTAYMDDVEKYAPNKTLANVMRHAIQHIPLAAGSRIKFEGFGNSNYKSREVGESLRMLEKAMLIQLIYPTVQAKPPAASDYKKSPRLHFLDTGLMNYVAGLQKHYFSLNDLNNLYKGQISENIVAHELLTVGATFNNQLKFWVREKRQANSEVDFVIPFDRYLIPIEVKSGKSGTLKSLMQFMEVADHLYAIRLYAGKLRQDRLSTPSGKEFTLYSLPYYLTGQLPRILEKIIC